MYYIIKLSCNSQIRMHKARKQMFKGHLPIIMTFFRLLLKL